MSSSRISPINSTPRTVHVTIHRCTHISNDSAAGWLGRTQQYFVRVTIGDISQETTDQEVDEGNQIVIWNEEFTFTNATSSSMTLTVYRRRTMRKEKLLERLAVAIREDAFQPSLIRAVTFLSGPKIEFSVNFSRTGSFEDVHEDLLTAHIGGGAQDNAEQVVAQGADMLVMDDSGGEGDITEQPGPVLVPSQEPKQEQQGSQDDKSAFAGVEKARQALNSLGAPKPLWKRVLKGIETFRDAVGVIAEAHPYAKLACAILYMIPGPLIEQLDRDEVVRFLLVSFTDFCDAINCCSQSDLGRDEDLKDVLKRASVQLTEVAYFVQEYCKDGSFLKRALKNQASGVDDMIEEFRARLDALRNEFHLRLSIETGAMVARTENVVGQVKVKVMLIITKVEELAQTANLDDIAYVPGAGLNEDKTCLPGTRTGFLDDIVQWASLDGPQVLLLIGGAGTGKSSIAHTIAARFKDMGRLGSMFCFSRAKKTGRGPESLFPHIARDLADLHSRIRNELCKATVNKADRTSSAITTQFEKLVLSPANAIREYLHGPIVVVIDALDESGSVEERKRLLEVLSSRLTELPANFRVVITSRPARDIEQIFARGASIVTKRMEDISFDTTRLDIAKFVESQFANDQEVSVKIRQDLSVQAQDLFQWAYVACQFVLNRGPGVTALDRYKALIPPPKKATPSPSPTDADNPDDTPLNQLYRAVLSDALAPRGKVSIDEFKFVMTWVLTVFEPLTCKSLNKLIAVSKCSWLGWKVERVMALLGSLMSGVDNHDVPIAPLHTSFRDFLTNIELSGEFFVNLSHPAIHSDIAWASFVVMEEELKFNICQLPTSHFPNKRIYRIEELIREFIQPHLSYACRFWISHLCLVPSTTHDWRQLSYEVLELMENRALYWLEVLSLLDASESGLREIRRMYSLMKMAKNVKQDILAWVRDLELFWSYFAKCISRSAPHIYISALPFAPKESLIAKKYASLDEKKLSIPVGSLSRYPPCLNIFHGHAGTIQSVAFSPDGTRIVSGSFDKSIRIWNVENGEGVLGPLHGHTDWVYSVAWSPDGTRITSGSFDKTIRIWNADTGQMVVGPLNGHTDSIKSVAFSPNGLHIVSGSKDKSIRVWNAENGERVLGPLTGHIDWVNSVAFSPDGTRIASGSNDRTIRIWSAENGETTLAPLKGHAGPVISVAFSTDSSRIISGSSDKTIRIWNVESGDMVLGPLNGHTGSVFSVAFSPDSSRIVSSSTDKTIRIWNTENGQMLFGPLNGHTDVIYSVTFSPDGTRIISGSKDTTIRLWNPEDSETGFAPLRGYNSPILSAAFSPDGMRIVSGSGDRTIQVWDAANGESVLGPLNGHTDMVFSVNFSPDGTRIVSGSKDKTIRIWDAENGQIVLGPLNGHTDAVISAAFSQCGTRIVSGSWDRTIRVWNAENGQTLLGPLNGHTHFVSFVSFSPDGARIISASRDSTIRIWDASNGQMALGPLRGHKNTVNSIAFSPDGSRIVSGSYDKTIRIWNAENGDMLFGPLGGHTKYIKSVSFSPDGTRIVSSSNDKTIRVWNAETGKMLLGPLFGHTGWVSSASFSPDGTRIVSGSYDSTIRTWDVQTKSAFDRDDTMVTRELATSPSPNNSLWHLNFEDNWTIQDDWVRDANGDLLLFVPPAHQLGLYTPRTLHCIGASPTHLDLTRFVHGSRWEESFRHHGGF